MRALSLVLALLVGCYTTNHWTAPRDSKAYTCMGECLADDTSSVTYCTRICRGATPGEGRCPPFDEKSPDACHEFQDLRVGVTLLIVFASLVAVGGLGYLAVQARVNEGGNSQ